MKPKIAIFSLTSCEGCSLAILELENELLDILGAVEIVNFREGMTERGWDIDIGFVDGAVSRALLLRVGPGGACAHIKGLLGSLHLLRPMAGNWRQVPHSQR